MKSIYESARNVMEAARGGALPNQPNFLDRLSNALSPSANRKRAEAQVAAVNSKAKEQNASNTLAAANMKAKEQNTSNALASANSKSKPQATLTSAKPAAKPGQSTMAAGPSQDKLNATQRSAEKSGPDTDTMKKGIAAGSPAMSSVDTTNRQAAADKPVEAPTASGSGSSSYTSSAGNAANKPVEKPSSSSYTSSAGNADNNPVEKSSSSSYTSSAGNADNNPVEKPQASATPAPSPAVDNTVKSGSGGTVTTSDGSPLKTRTDDEIAKQNKKGRGAAMESVNKKFNISDALYHSVMEVMKKDSKEGSIPRNEKEKDLAAFHGDPKRITHGDVLKARGVTKEEVANDDIHPAGVTLLKQIKPQHRNLYKPHLTTDVFNGSYKDRTDILKAAEDAGHLKEDVDQQDQATSHQAAQDKEMIKAKRLAMAKSSNAFTQTAPYPSFKKVAKKAFKALTGGSDKDQLDRLKKDMYVKEASSKEEQHDTISHPLSKDSFKDGMKYASGTSGTVHNSKTHYVKETETGNDTDSNIVYGIHDKATGKIHGVSISAFKKTTPEKVAKATGSSTVNPAHKALAAHHNETTYVKENKDTPGNSYEHQCAVHVKSESFGEGRTITTQHASPDADGNIAWYDVMFEHGIEKQVPTNTLEILVSEMHMHSKKKKKMM